MSITSEITRIGVNISNAYSACNSKGATMPQTQNSANLATCINSITTGITPTGTISITENGTYNVTNYASATVNNTWGGVPPHDILPRISDSIVSETSAYHKNLVFSDIEMIKLQGAFAYRYLKSYVETVSFSDLYAVKGDINQAIDFDFQQVDDAYRAFCSTFYKCQYLTTIGFPELELVDGDEAFAFVCYNCPSLTSVDLAKLESVIGKKAFYCAFHSCYGYSGAIDLSSLYEICGEEAFYRTFYDMQDRTNHTGLTSADLSSLNSITGTRACYRMFQSNPYFTSVDLSSLETVDGSEAMKEMFKGTALTSLSFPSLTSTGFGTYTNQFNDMLSGVTGCTVHFPSNLQNIIGSWSDVQAGFGGTNTTVLFDLTATT